MSTTAENTGVLPEDSNKEATTSQTASLREGSPGRIRSVPGRESASQTILSTVEILFIIAWAVFFARDYLDFSPDVWPTGREFGMAIQTHFIWTLLPICGDCVFWNGFINGGAPAFAELHGAVLHPLVILSTLIWGAVNGAKVVLIASLAMAGIAQWWLAKAMKLDLIIRLWAGMMAVVGGHLAGRMGMGVVGVVLSTAAASLVVAAGVDLALTRRRRSAILLGIMLALAIVSGQGYLQIGLLLGVLPAFVVFLFDKNLRLQPIWREYALALLIALLLAGVFWTPMVHFWPNFGKGVTLDNGGIQTLGDSVLNLVISDLDVYFKETLGATPYPYQYTAFLGWIPILLAILALRLVPRRQTQLLSFFIIAIVLVYMLASAVTLNWLRFISPEFITSFRNPSIIAGLAVPLVLGLAAWSADLIFRKNWPVKILSPGHENEGEAGNSRNLSFSLSWIFIGALLFLSLRNAYEYSHFWIDTTTLDESIPIIIEEAEKINPAYTQWTNLPYGEHHFMPNALDSGLKLAVAFRPWDWRDRDPPDVRLVVNRDPNEQENPNYLGTYGGTFFRENPDIEYAFVQTGTEIVPCDALAQGGHIDVTCTTNSPGKLIVQENLWSGWEVERDGQAILMAQEPWLNAEAPAGTYHYRFRYRPWDVYLGLTLTIIGVALCIWLWFFRTDSVPTTVAPIPIPESGSTADN